MEYKYAQALAAVNSVLRKSEFMKNQPPRKMYTQKDLDQFAKNYK